jgi:hypothetical protein
MVLLAMILLEIKIKVFIEIKEKIIIEIQIRNG